jgi:hypothetical protein
LRKLFEFEGKEFKRIFIQVYFYRSRAHCGQRD